MTSNIGAAQLQKEAGLGFQARRASDLEDLDALHQQNKDKVLDKLKRELRPELLNRIDKVIVFRALTKKEINYIIDLQVDELRHRLVKQGIDIKLSKSAKDYLLENGYDAMNGVRPMRRLIQDTLEDHIATKLLDQSYGKGTVLKVSSTKKGLEYVTVKE